MCNSITPKGSYFPIQVEELSNSWSEFEVLIHVEETTFQRESYMGRWGTNDFSLQIHHNH